MAEPLNILLVMNHPDSVEVLLRILSRRGYEVLAATSIASAMEAFKDSRFDVLLSDIRLQDGDGCDLVRRLLEKQPSLFAIAQRSHFTAEDANRCHEAGFRRLITKPIAIDDLYRILDEAAAG